MRPAVRFLVGVTLGAIAIAAYLWVVGVGTVLGRATTIAPLFAVLVLALVLAEGAADGIGVWASLRPLNGGLSPRKSVQFAFAGDFFDTLSPAGPVTSEPIMARFFAVETETSYSEALGVRGVAKYVKSGAQLLVSTVLVVVLVLLGLTPSFLVYTLGGAVVVLFVVGLLLVVTNRWLSGGLVVLLTPPVRLLSSLYRAEPYGREDVTAAVDRFWMRAGQFRDAPGLVALIAVGGIVEQLLTAGALWVALGGIGTPVALLPIVAVIPLPQAASVVPVPASLGAYDVLLGVVLGLLTVASQADAAAAVFAVRTFSIGSALAIGGVSTGFLRGWRP
ncbi:lysylphosphatidylglycerol synthase domain-containing protein [Haloarchaeobius baliensis]|uniref:lysylphosphatidylglycerol synthase domain-containing protein n=1 Tax=Haloarchaeobius baliensis TaxID=1670458 RepID=UPI003F884E41